MKKLIVLIFIFTLLLPTSAALAEGESTAEPTPGPSQEALGETGTAEFAIDTQHAYPGMDKSFAQGYMPSVADGFATIVLPLIVSNGSICDTVTASIDLGDPTTAPFVFKNYVNDFSWSTYTVDVGDASCCLISFSLELQKGRINGSYPVAVHAEGVTQEGAVLSDGFTLYVVIADGKSAEAETPKEPVALPQPKLIVESYVCSAQPLEAGSEAELTLTIRNTSTSQSVKNIKMSFQDQAGEILPEATGTVYVSNIKKGEYAECVFDIRAAENASARAHVLTITMEYENSKAAAFSSSETIVLDVTQPIRLEYEQPKLPSKVTEDDNVAFSMNIMNLGKSTVYNVLLKFEIPGLNNGGSILAGNIQPGESKEATTNLLVSSMDGQYGDVSGKILLSYENESGERFERELSVQTRIEKKIIPVSNDTQEIEKKDKTLIPWWTWVAAGVILLGMAGLAIWKITKSKRQRDLDERNL